MNTYTTPVKSIYLKSFVLLAIIALSLFSCQKEDNFSVPVNNERFKVPSINDAKVYFETNNKVPIFQDSNNGIEHRTGTAEMTIKWDESTPKKYKGETETIPQQVDILYTPIELNTEGNVKLFLASIEDNGTVDSRYISLIYTRPENPKLFSGYIFIYDLDGNLENTFEYEEGSRVSIPPSNRMNQRGDGDEFFFETLGELLDWLGGDWFGLDGFIFDEEVLIIAQADGEHSGGNSGGDYSNSSIYIPVVDFTGFGSGNGGNGSDPYNFDMDWWQPISIFAHGLSISNAIEVDLNSIEAQWLTETATQEQLDAIADYLNNADQTENGGYRQSAIDYIMDMINLLNNSPNLSLTTDNSSNTDGYLEFDSFDDYEDYLSNLNNPNQSYSNEDFNSGTNRRYSFTYEYNTPFFSHGIKAEIIAVVPDQNSCECLEISSVTTELFGNTTLVEWTQIGDYWTELSQTNDTLTVFVRGKKIRGVKIDGWRWQQTIIFTYYMTLDYSTGYVIDYGTYSII